MTNFLRLIVLTSVFAMPMLGCGKSGPTVIEPLPNDAELQSLNDEMAEAANEDTE